jgi:hypothetical protein
MNPSSFSFMVISVLDFGFAPLLLTKCQVPSTALLPITTSPDLQINRLEGGAPPPGFHPIPPNLTQGHPTVLGFTQAPSEPALCPAAKEKSAEGRRLRFITPKMQNPAQKPGRKNACVPIERVAQPLSAVQISQANRMANKIRNHRSMIPANGKKIFQGRRKAAANLPRSSELTTHQRRRREIV